MQLVTVILNGIQMLESHAQALNCGEQALSGRVLSLCTLVHLHAVAGTTEKSAS